MLPPLLRRNMLHHTLPPHLRDEALNKPRIPEFARDAEVFAAAHQGVGFAALGRGWDAAGVEVLLFAAGYGDEARRQWVLVGGRLEGWFFGCTYRPPQTRPYSRVTILPVTIVSPRGARPQPPGPKARFKILLYLISGRYIIPSGLISMSSDSIFCCNMSACSAVKGAEDKPW